jgi:uncharacterized protein (TIGR03435 family)
VRRALLTLAIVGATAATPTAQDPAARFEATSIKRNTDGLNQTSMATLPSGRFVARGVPLRDLIGYAYGETDPFLPLPNNRIIGSPDWADSERFDIDAVVSTDGAGPELSKVLQMLRTLLTERFHMVAHHERRELPVYVLTVTRTDGALGPQLRRSDGGCSLPPAKRTAAASCGMQRRRGYIEARGMTVDSILLHGLNANLDRVVINNTGLVGEFDWTLEWGAETRPDSDNASVSQAGAAGPSIFTAMPEQLGLKLEPSRGPVDVLLIESVERPTPN